MVIDEMVMMVVFCRVIALLIVRAQFEEMWQGGEEEKEEL